MVSATSLTARSVMVKSEADVPDFTSQLILFAVCVTKVMLPSAVSIRVLKLLRSVSGQKRTLPHFRFAY